jgi:hypothetical protein
VLCIARARMQALWSWLIAVRSRPRARRSWCRAAAAARGFCFFILATLCNYTVYTPIKRRLCVTILWLGCTSRFSLRRCIRLAFPSICLLLRRRVNRFAPFRGHVRKCKTSYRRSYNINKLGRHSVRLVKLLRAFRIFPHLSTKNASPSMRIRRVVFEH